MFYGTRHQSTSHLSILTRFLASCIPHPHPILDVNTPINSGSLFLLVDLSAMNPVSQYIKNGISVASSILVCKYSLGSPDEQPRTQRSRISN